MVRTFRNFLCSHFIEFLLNLKFKFSCFVKIFLAEAFSIFSFKNSKFILLSPFQIGKNLYQWHGTTHQTMTLAWLRHLGLKLNMLQRYNDVRQMESNTDENAYMISPCSDRDILRRSPLSVSSASSSFTASPASSCSPSPSPVERKTSLGVACQKFLMLFLVLPEVSV